MFQAVHASHNQSLYLTRLGGVGDIAHRVRDHRMETITSTDRSIVVWFTVHQGIRTVNRPVTEILIAATGFTASDVPLLRGNAVITGCDEEGRPADLSDEQVCWLAGLREARGRAAWILQRRYAQERRAARRGAREAFDRQVDAAWGAGTWSP